MRRAGRPPSILTPVQTAREVVRTGRNVSVFAERLSELATAGRHTFLLLTPRSDISRSQSPMAAPRESTTLQHSVIEEPVDVLAVPMLGVDP